MVYLSTDMIQWFDKSWECHTCHRLRILLNDVARYRAFTHVPPQPTITERKPS